MAWPLPEKFTNSQTLLKHWHFNNRMGESRDPDLHDICFSRIWSKFLSENPCFFSEQIVLLEDQFWQQLEHADSQHSGNSSFNLMVGTGKSFLRLLKTP